MDLWLHLKRLLLAGLACQNGQLQRVYVCRLTATISGS
jgi:hypothetical protein